MHNNSTKLGQLKTYDPRIKLYIMLTYLLISLVSWKLYSVLVSIAVALMIFGLCKVRFLRLLDMTKDLIAAMLFIGVILVFAVNIKIGIYITCKFLLITFVFMAVMNNMKQVEILDGLSQGFKLKADAAKRLSLILDFIPEVDREKIRVCLAQSARGVEIDRRDLIGQVRKDLILAIPVYRNAFHKVQRRSRAMDMRQYTSVRRRTRMYELNMTWIDHVVLIFFVIMLLVCILLMIL